MSPIQLPGGKLADRWEGPPTQPWYDAVIQSLGNVLGKTMSLPFNGYGSLQPESPLSSNSVLGPFLDPIISLHRHHPLPDTGPWPLNDPVALHLTLAKREVQWLESSKGQQLFDAWRTEMHPTENHTETLPAFLELTRTLATNIVPHMYTLFLLPENAYRPALSHSDFHSNNILMSYNNPTHITGVVDWEFTSILQLWAAYAVPPEIQDSGNKYERNPLWCAEKKRLREVFAQEVVQTCPDAVHVLDKQNIRGLRMLVGVATSGVALYNSFKDVGLKLVKICECVKGGDAAVLEKLDRLVALFSLNLSDGSSLAL
ncbi:hypothetical protein PILCRDRAFT_14380 [Piloderma croceum F 1598]|uniref:Aminoglycoside phosphotransferase domain-containing protein n=1 Tax=Piloderma croceum (strain F 1598) TaxID=765440 RepID=A0A0C3EPH9_PILCF|nr:hypothetical protein PILCRDRAFT_14380 [Piloderma croceum F 1598]